MHYPDRQDVPGPGTVPLGSRAEVGAGGGLLLAGPFPSGAFFTSCRLRRFFSLSERNLGTLRTKTALSGSGRARRAVVSAGPSQRLAVDGGWSRPLLPEVPGLSGSPVRRVTTSHSDGVETAGSSSARGDGLGPGCVPLGKASPGRVCRAAALVSTARSPGEAFKRTCLQPLPAGQTPWRCGLSTDPGCLACGRGWSPEARRCVT